MRRKCEMNLSQNYSNFGSYITNQMDDIQRKIFNTNNFQLKFNKVPSKNVYSYKIFNELTRPWEQSFLSLYYLA